LNVTVSRGSTSVDIPVVQEDGEPLILVDKGKPEAKFKNTQSANPRYVDIFSQLENYNILGRFFGADAHDKAIDIADLIKQPSNGFPLQLEIPDKLGEFPDSEIDVAPSAGADEALKIAYNPGRTDWVELDLGLTRVSNTIGSDVGQTVTTPTASGTGPVELTDGNLTVQFKSDVSVSRGIGRPLSTASRSSQQYVRYVDKPKAAVDRFEITAQFLNNSERNISDLRSMIGQTLNRTALTLDFNGLFNLGSFSVAPEGSGAFRHIREAGYGNAGKVPQLTLRRVQT